MPTSTPSRRSQESLAQRIAANVGTAIMHLQIGCAQCHEHKFDPISHADFYRMRAIFELAVNVKKNISVSLLEEVNPSPAKSHLRIRGDWDRLGPESSPHFFVSSIPPIPIYKPSRRACLARRRDDAGLSRRAHPRPTPVDLTSHRQSTWQQHFGHGLSRSPVILIHGDAPTHPLLLDWLATELTKGDWSLKRLH